MQALQSVEKYGVVSWERVMLVEDPVSKVLI